MKNKNLIFLLIVLSIAAFFRLWQLDEIPPGLYPDVAINGNEALESLKTGNFKLFYSENNGREGLFIWLIALSFLIFGVNVWSIKIVAAVIGILTVFGLYLLTKDLFEKTIDNKRKATDIALLSSFFLAISFWHVNFSRIGFRAILLPFVLVFFFYFLFKGFKKRGILNFIIAGIFFGLGFYTYTSFRMAVLILPFILIPYWFIYKKENSQKKFLFLVSCFLFLVFVIALPIGIYFLKNPQDFISRAAPISVFKASQPLEALLKSLISHLAMFNFYGDQNLRHNFFGSPMIFWPIGILFLIGIFLSLKELIYSIKSKNLSLLTCHLFLISWFFIMLLPGILTYEGIPHSLRVIGVIPAVFIFAALGTDFLIKKIKINWFLITLLGVFFFSLVFAEYYRYFILWGKNPEVKGAFTKIFADIGYYLNSLPQDFQKYVIVNESGVPVPWPDGIPMPAQTIMFVENTKYGFLQSVYLLPKEINKIKIEKRGIILPMADDENTFKEIREKFPQGEIKKIDNFSAYEINQ
ncbi:hypothetical protein AMJ49_03275 [Parcubacteria bacterium DG_74_2]|nr:MAG: hypothetical protein AMJ49_03275 [Parcubacteria bacterium DG_74_2]